MGICGMEIGERAATSLFRRYSTLWAFLSQIITYLGPRVALMLRNIKDWTYDTEKMKLRRKEEQPVNAQTSHRVLRTDTVYRI